MLHTIALSYRHTFFAMDGHNIVGMYYTWYAKMQSASKRRPPPFISDILGSARLELCRNHEEHITGYRKN
jgi:hypothetical protein